MTTAEWKAYRSDVLAKLAAVGFVDALETTALWFTGTIGSYHVCLQVFGVAGPCGINGGRISRLTIQAGPVWIPIEGENPWDHILANYDRQWSYRPRTKGVGRLVRRIVAAIDGATSEK